MRRHFYSRAGQHPHPWIDARSKSTLISRCCQKAKHPGVYFFHRASTSWGSAFLSAGSAFLSVLQAVWFCLLKRPSFVYGIFLFSRMSSATSCFTSFHSGCQTPRSTSHHFTPSAKRHILFHFFSQKPHFISREQNLPGQTSDPLKQSVAFDIFSEAERDFWQAGPLCLK